MTELPPERALQRSLRLVAALNFGYFTVEFTVAAAIGSVALFADSIDFLEDASLNVLIVVALGWTALWRTRLAMGLAAVIFLPTMATLWTAWGKFLAPTPPEPLALSLTGTGALAINVICALLLSRHRQHSGSLAVAAFLSARNDALANAAIIAAGLATAYTLSAWPDLLVGLGIAALNADAARQVWTAARRERLDIEI